MIGFNKNGLCTLGHVAHTDRRVLGPRRRLQGFVGSRPGCCRGLGDAVQLALVDRVGLGPPGRHIDNAVRRSATMRRAERARIRIPQQTVVAQVPHVLLQHVQVIALGAHPLVDLQHVRIQRRHRRAHRRGRRGRRHRAIAADLAHRIGRRARLAVRAHRRPTAQRRGQRLARIPVRLVRRRLHCLIDLSGHRLAITDTGEFRVGRIGLALGLARRDIRGLGGLPGRRRGRLCRRHRLLGARRGAQRRIRRPLRARRGLLRVRRRLPHAVKLPLVHRIRRRNARRHVRNSVLCAVRVGRGIGLLRRIPHQSVAPDLVDAVHHLLVGAQALQLRCILAGLLMRVERQVERFPQLFVRGQRSAIQRAKFSQDA
ncbi:Uncharacterised protein [Achromobacter xylosoxidans]|nr:Uncharacterised protein [Achromobacter xylosoxidans]